ncbi:Hypothetical_protein [Hexamita inflata]|uniref:Hypothetical_protein n=1 Tax=Hexamita inflata TaxID=28002 RepID=A0ABP1I384_9EUKA
MFGRNLTRYLVAASRECLHSRRIAVRLFWVSNLGFSKSALRCGIQKLKSYRTRRSTRPEISYHAAPDTICGNSKVKQIRQRQIEIQIAKLKYSTDAPRLSLRPVLGGAASDAGLCAVRGHSSLLQMRGGNVVERCKYGVFVFDELMKYVVRHTQHQNRSKGMLRWVFIRLFQYPNQCCC